MELVEDIWAVLKANCDYVMFVHVHKHETSFDLHELQVLQKLECYSYVAHSLAVYGDQGNFTGKGRKTERG